MTNPSSSSTEDPYQAERERFKEYFLARLKKALEDNEASPRRWASLLQEITGRTDNAARGWLAGEALPDLDAFRRIVFKLGLDADEMLGINTKSEIDARRISEIEARGLRLETLLDSEPRLGKYLRPLAETPEASILLVQRSDEMEPEISRGETFGVDASITSIRGNGVYALERYGQIFVRRVNPLLETDTLVLQPANPRYAQEKIATTPDGHPVAVNVIGQVIFVIKKV